MLANHANVIQFPNLRPANVIPVVIPKTHIANDVEGVTVSHDLPLIDALTNDVLIISRRYSRYTEKSIFVVRVKPTDEITARRLEYNGETVMLKSLVDPDDDYMLAASDVVIMGKVIGIQRPFDF